MLRSARVALVVLVVAFVGRHLWSLYHDFSGQRAALSRVTLGPWWMAASVLLFAAGQVFFASFWRRLLRRCGATAAWSSVLPAYVVGTLGKYVPGKAWVVLLRAGLAREDGVSRFHVGLSSVYETMGTMAVGAALAGSCLFVGAWAQWWYAAASVVAACGLLVGLHPAVFSRLAGMVSIPFKPGGEPFPARACFAELSRSSALVLAGWLCLGGSLWATVRALGAAPASVTDSVVIVGAAATATSLGFLVVFMPAGIGVRELVVVQLLGPRIGFLQAVLASVLLRVVWTGVEVGSGAVSYVVRRRALNGAERIP